MQEKFRVSGQKGLRTLEKGRAERNRARQQASGIHPTPQVEGREVGTKEGSEGRAGGPARGRPGALSPVRALARGTLGRPPGVEGRGSRGGEHRQKTGRRGKRMQRKSEAGVGSRRLGTQGWASLGGWVRASVCVCVCVLMLE